MEKGGNAFFIPLIGTKNATRDEKCPDGGMDMARELDQLRRLAPEEVARMELRYDILSAIANRGPIGRRALAASLHKPERTVRTEADCLRMLGLVQPAAGGMRVTADGEELLGQLQPMLRALSGVDRLGQQLRQHLEVATVYVQAGDVEQDPMVLRELCRQAGNVILGGLKEEATLAVMGGHHHGDPGGHAAPGTAARGGSRPGPGRPGGKHGHAGQYRGRPMRAAPGRPVPHAAST